MKIESERAEKAEAELKALKAEWHKQIIDRQNWEMRAHTAESELKRMSDDLETMHGLKEEHRHKLEELGEASNLGTQLGEALTRVDKYKEAFRWLDAYWATDPDMTLPKICPVCSRDSDEFECDQCHDNSWDLYEKARAEAGR